MLKFASKFVLEILPSVVATIVGAYIVHYYIIPRAAADRPAAAVASTVNPKAMNDHPAGDKDLVTKASSDTSPDAAIETAAPKPGVKPAVEKNSDNNNNSSAAALPRRHQPAPREKAVTDERRDANGLARAAIERLRITNEQRPQEAPRPQDTAHAQDAPRVASVPPMQQLPPPITVSTSAIETFNPGQPAVKPPDTQINRAEESPRPRPPGEIPFASRPLDLHAEATGSTGQDRTTMTQDVLSAAKSVFHAVLPK